MKNKKTLLMTMGFVLAMSLSSCVQLPSPGGNDNSDNNKPTSTVEPEQTETIPESTTIPSTPKKKIALIAPQVDHGWMGATFAGAKAKAEEINKTSDKYEVQLFEGQWGDAGYQMYEDIIARKEEFAGIACMPLDNSYQNVVEKIVQNEIPLSQFDRYISTPVIDNSEYLVSNVTGDNYGLGALTAKEFLKNGLTKDDKVLIMTGDTSSVPMARNTGFRETIQKAGIWQAESEYHEHVIESDWTGWSRSKSEQLFTNWAAQYENDPTFGGFKYIFTHDSEIAIGVLDALRGNLLPMNVKENFKNNIKMVAASSGLEEMYQIIRGDHPHSYDYNAVLGNAKLFDVTYDPTNIKYCVDDLMDYLDGKKVEKKHVVPSKVIDNTNVNDIVGFGGRVDRY